MDNMVFVYLKEDNLKLVDTMSAEEADLDSAKPCGEIRRRAVTRTRRSPFPRACSPGRRSGVGTRRD